MALRVCGRCSTAFAAGLPRCPHCGSTDHHEEGSSMPKITRHGGPSVAGEHGPEPKVPAPAAPLAAGREADASRDDEGGASSPGNSSSASSATPKTSSAQSRTAGRKPARTTESPSAPDRTDSSTARSTAGSGTADADN